MAVKKKFPYKAAIVSCNGGCRAVKGEAGCSEGCIGCGACVDACKFGAISMNEYGVAEVDERRSGEETVRSKLYRLRDLREDLYCRCC